MVEQSTSGKRRPSRARGKSVAAEQLRALKAKRDAADAEIAERKRREDAALERYAEAVAAGVAVEEELERELAALDRKREELRTAAERRKAQTAAEAAAALAEIVALPGRSVEEVAGWVDLPVKRVRRMVRDAKAGQGPARGSEKERPAVRPASSVPAVAVSGAAEAPTAPPAVAEAREAGPVAVTASGAEAGTSS